MNGAEALIATVIEAGIDICFANPGTTEMPIVLAMDALPGLKPVLCLHETIATSAADGYARLAGKPAMCLLHLGPGFANGIANLHNARRAASPVLNVVGQHASWHVEADPLLAADLAGLAKSVSGFARESANAAAISGDVADAIEAAIHKRAIATLIVPHDFQMAEALPSSRPRPRTRLTTRGFREARVDGAATALKSGKTALLLGGDGLSEAGLMAAGRIAAATGADLFCDTFFARMERGAGLPIVRRLPYFADQALAVTKSYARIIVAGTRQPVAFFGYPGLPSHMISAEQTVMLADGAEDAVGALLALVETLQAPAHFEAQPPLLPDLASGALTTSALSTVIGRLQPENAIIMDEALTAGVPYFESSKGAPRFTHLTLTGGAIGQGPGAATGAAFAAPDRKVINFQSDGCGAYSVQALWTQARHNLDVVTVIGSNRSYNILKVEMLRAGITQPGLAGKTMTGLDQPYLDWVKIGEGFGVPSVAVDNADALLRELDSALQAKGPRLIEAIVSG